MGLAANSNHEELAKQIELVDPERVCLVEEEAAAKLRDRIETRAEVLSGESGLVELARSPSATTVLNAIVGSAGLAVTIASLEAGKHLALANKESLVAAGELVMQKLIDHGGSIVPVDSEHSALWQCLVGEDRDSVSRLILTASGGPFWGRDHESLVNVTPQEALAHPRWEMGPRITIDSATMVNKGLEVIEAQRLFGVGYDQIDVLIHPQSIVHSMVEFTDGSIKAQLSSTDMKLPIQYGLAWPERLDSAIEPLRLAEVGRLDFDSLETGRAPCFDLAVQAGKAGRSYPAVLNAGDEIAVGAFLAGMIRFTEIGNIIDTVLTGHDPLDIQSVDDFSQVDAGAREAARAEVSRIKKVGT